VRQLWLTAEAKVESVCESVCITILLPNLIDLVVKASSSGRTVRMFAKRLVIDDKCVKGMRKLTRVFKVGGKDEGFAEGSEDCKG